eukprot:773518-Lingulodinium_polyedra.AAC.1
MCVSHGVGDLQGEGFAQRPGNLQANLVAQHLVQYVCAVSAGELQGRGPQIATRSSASGQGGIPRSRCSPCSDCRKLLWA